MGAAPKWLDDVVGGFGRGAGLRGLSLGERGAVTLDCGRGMAFTLEYVHPGLTVCMTVEAAGTVETAKKVLQLAEPLRRGRYAVRTGFMPRGGRAFFAVRLAQDAVTQPVLAEVFRELRRLAERFAGGAL